MIHLQLGWLEVLALVFLAGVVWPLGARVGRLLLAWLLRVPRRLATYEERAAGEQP